MANESLRSLEAEATRMMRELGDLTAKLRELGDKRPEELAQGAVDAVSAHMKRLKEEAAKLSEDAPAVIAKVDKSVRANPYVWIFGALGLGWLLGKIGRS